MKTLTRTKTAIKTGLAMALVVAMGSMLAAWERSSIADDIPEDQKVLMPLGGVPMMMLAMSGGSKISLSDPKAYYEVRGAPAPSGAAPELKSIAASFDYSAGRIIDWVRNYIDFEPYNGLKRGAKLTALERAGNSFDQAVLTVELLRASGFTASYVFVNMEIPVGNASEWLGVAPDHLFSYLVNNQMDYVARTSAPAEGLPLVYYTGYGNTTVKMPQVWVKLVLGGQELYFDPSCKLYAKAAPAPWKSISSYSAATLYNAAGGTDGIETIYYNGDSVVLPSYVGNPGDKDKMRNQLSQFTTNLVTAIKNNDTHYSQSGREVMGGRWVDLSGPFAGAEAEPLEFWDDIPEDYKTRLYVQVGNINHFFFTADIDGGKISIGFNGSNAVLYLNDNQVAAETDGSGVSAAVMLTYRYVVNGTYPNGLYKHGSPAAPISRQGHYVINHGSAFVTGRIKERMRILANLLEKGCAGNSRQVITENLYIMGLNYLNELNNINEVASATLPARITLLHHAGVVGMTNAPFVDLPVNLLTIGVNEMDTEATYDKTTLVNNAFMASAYWASMLEHSIIEQMLITDASSTNTHLNKGVSTTKFLQTYVDNKHKIYAPITQAQWNGLKASGVLQNYDQAPGIIAAGDKTFAANSSKGLMLLPRNYVQSHKGYNGMGYIALSYSGSTISATMGITGVLGLLNGGSYSEPTIFNQSTVSTNDIISRALDPYVWNGSLSLTSSDNTTGKILSLDPVDLSSGAFYLCATDMTVGNGTAPYGLAFTRIYSTAMRSSDATGLGKGWTHNYNIRLAYQHAGDLDLDRATTADVAPIMVAVNAIYDSYNYNSSPTAKQYVVPALVACWLGDQFINSRVVVQEADRLMTFVKLPNGNFAPPAGVAATLTRSGNAHTMKMRKGLEYAFDAEGRISSITDRNTDKQTARSLTMTYTADRLTQVKDAYNRTLTLDYSGDRLAKVTDKSSANRYTSYNDTGIAFTYTDPEEKTTTYYKDARDRITSIQDALVRTTIINTYDNYDRIVIQHSLGDTNKEWRYDYAPGAARECDPKGGVSLYYFDTKGRHIMHCDQLGNRTQTKYDGQNRVVARITPKRDRGYALANPFIEVLADGTEIEHEITYFDYDKNHELTAVTDPAGRITTSEPSNDTSSTPRHDTSAGGLKVRTDYFENIHLPKLIIRHGNIQETFAYDNYGRLVRHHPAAYEDGSDVTYAYTPTTGVPTQLVASYPGVSKETTKFDNIGNVIETTSRAGIKTTYTYNKRRQITKTIVWDGTTEAQTSQVFYDDVGNVLYTEDPRHNWVDYTYNANGKLESVTDPLGNTIMNTYDLRNLLSATIDPLGFRTENTYDLAQRLIAVKNVLGHSTSATYDPLGNKLSSTTALGHTNGTENDDARFLPTKIIDALGRDITYDYDADGRQTSMTNRRGHIYTTAYDDDNRTIITTTPEGKETTMIANERGLMDTIFRPSDKTVKNTTFDSEGRVLVQTIFDVDNATVLASSTMTYDTAGRLDSVSENGRVTTRAFDTLGRLASYSDGEGNTITYGYDAANNLTTLTYPGDLTVTYSYDANNRLLFVSDWNSGTTSYRYDAVGRLTETLRPNNTARKQVYDAAGQLRFIEERGPANSLLWMRGFEYDADGRITKTYTWPSNTQSGYSALNASDTASYDADNRIKQLSLGNGESISVEFDDDGNMTQGPAVNNPIGTGLSYQYDARNRLTGVGGTPLYRYNPDGHRVEASGVRYVIDPNDALSRVLMRKQGNATTYYIWGAAGLEYEIDGTTTRTYHADHLGSTMLLTDSSGAPTDYFEYDSYGAPTYRLGFTDTPFCWHGTLGVATEANGLVHMRARFYHPRIMRFLNQDPIGFEGGMNWFAAFDNNPIGNVDPLGLCSSSGGGNNNIMQYGAMAGLVAAPGVGAATSTGMANSVNVFTSANAGASAGSVIARASVITSALAFVALCPGDTRVDPKTEAQTYSGIVYMKINKNDSSMYYIGRSAGFGTPLDLLMARDVSLHRNEDYGPAIIHSWVMGQKSQYTTIYSAVRGREQQIIDYYGGVGSSTVGNSIRGVSKNNPYGYGYWESSNKTWGTLAPFTGNISIGSGWRAGITNGLGPAALRPPPGNQSF